MKLFPIAAPVVAFVLLFSTPSRADVIVESVRTIASGDASVGGYALDQQSQTNQATGFFNTTVSGSSGFGADLATYSTTVTANVAPDGSLITTSGSTFWSFSVSTEPVNSLSSIINQAIGFSTLGTPQTFTLNGTMSLGDIYLQNNATGAYLIPDVFYSSESTVSFSGQLSANTHYTLWYGDGTQLGNTVAPPASASNSGNFDLTFKTSSATTPEPSSLCLVGLAATAVAGCGWRRRTRRGLSSE